MPGTDLYSTQDNVLPTNKIMELGSPKASGPMTAFVESGERRADYLPPLPEQIAPTVTTKELYDNRKFGLYNPNKTEEDYAYGQSALNKAGNGIAKLAGTTASTIVNNTVGLLYGATSAIVNQKFSSLYDNEFFKKMDDVSTEMENRFPHYYTEAERKDPLALKSIFTGNFFWDKIVKNLGYSAGSAVTAYGATAALEALQLSKGLVAAGRGLQALEATEAGLAEGRGMAGVIQALKNPRSVASKLGQGLEALGTVEAGAQASTATRLLSSYLGVSGEAGMESYQNAKSFREKAIDVFKKEHNGQDPTGQDLQNIEDAAASVGNWSFGLNVALLTGTEYVQLPKIFGSTYSGEKKILNNIMFKDNLWKSALPEKGFGKFLYKAGNVGSLFFNTAEAFEEGAQYAIQEGTQNFFNKKYRSGEQTSFWNSLGGLLMPGGQGVIGYGTGRAVTTDEGLENILLGGLSGALMTSGIVGTRRTEDGTTVPTMFQTGKIGERGFTGYGGERGRFTDEATKALNSAKFTDLVDSVNRGMSINEDREKTLRQGDILQSKDLETDYMLNYLLPRIKYGGETIFNTETEAIAQKAATEAGFMELKDSGVANENDTQQSFVARLNNIQNMAKKVTENYDKFRTKYAGLAKTKEDGTPELDADGNLQRKYDDATVDKMVYTASKIFDYNNRIPGLSNKLSNSNIDATTILAEINFTGKPTVESVKEALQKINDLNEIDATKNDLKTSLQDVIELALRRNKFIDEFNNIEKDPSKYKEGTDETITPGDTVKIKQFEVGAKGKKKVVSKEIEVGKEYSLANPLANVGGKLQFAPKLTVLSKTLRGEFEVRLPNGDRAFLTPSDFKNYQLFGGSEDTSTLQDILDKATDKVLSKSKYNDITKPTENKLEYVNSLNNSELVDEIEKEFKAQGEEYLKESAKEQEAIESANLGKELAETQDIDTLPTADFDSGSFNPSPKKSDQEVVDSTTAPVEGFSEDVLAPHHVRANKFGANFYDLPGKDNFRGVIVTSANEAKVGLPGLTDWLKTEGSNAANIKPEETIALVVMGTDPITNERFFVGVNGERLEKPTLENTIYQVFPKTLKWADGDSMFRETTDKDTIEQYTKEYNAWRKSTLNNPSIDLYKIGASFGVPDTIPSASISVVSSGLVSANDLNTRRVIGIPTTDGAVVYGSSTFEGVKGVPLLYTANGLIRLNNRKNTRKEAELIFDVIERLASNLIKDKNLKSGESQALYNWLKSVVYWGTPQDVNGNRKRAAYSSIFFENMQLLVGKEETKFSIKPSDLKQNREVIIGKLQEMYNNVNSTLITGGQTKQWNKPYTEITGIEGDRILTRDWKNYQTYLLSNVNPDGSERSSESLPLSTSVRPLNNEEDVNRKGIYFTVYDKKGNTSNEVPAAKPVKKEPTPAAPVTPTAVAKPTGYVIDGKTENTMSTKLGDVSFIVDPKAFNESNGTRGVALSIPETTLEITVGKLLSIPNSGVTEETPDEEATKIAENVLRNIVIKEVKAQLAPAAAPVVEQAPAPTAPVVSDIEAKKADIERRRQEELNKKSTQGTLKNSPLDDIPYYENKVKEAKERLDRITAEEGEFVPGSDRELSSFQEMLNKAKKKVDNINAKYDAELAALEGAKPAAPVTLTSTPLAVLETLDRAQAKLNTYTDFEQFKPAVQAYLDGKRQQLLDPKLSPQEREKIAKEIEMDTKIPVVSLNGLELAYTELDRDTKINVSSSEQNEENSELNFYIKPAAEANYNANPSYQKKQGETLRMPGSAAGIEINNPTAVKTVGGLTANEAALLDYVLTDSVSKNSIANTDAIAKQQLLATVFKNYFIENAAGRINRSFWEYLQDPRKEMREQIEATPAAATTVEETPTPTPNVSANLQARINARKKAGPTKRGSEYRLKVEEQLKKFQSEDWNKVEKFIAKVLPNVPVYRVKNIIQTTNGKQAWGMLKDGAIYLYENAEVGTVYHEVFEAVWKMFTTAEERASIIDEFKNRKGIYTDSFTGRDIKYSDATDQEIKEQLAEEFRDQMLSKEAKKDKSLISRIFSQIIDFIKTFFVGDKAQENTNKLFENIGSGYYAQYSPFHGALSYAKQGIIDIEDAVGSDDAEYRITGFTGTQLHDVIQHMTYTIVKDLFETNEGLTNLAEKTKQQIYSGLKDEMGDLIADNVYQLEQMTDVADEERNIAIEAQYTLYANILNNWESIIDKHEEYLKSYSIEFDENDELSLGDERSKDDPYGDASKIDHMKKANSAIKLLLASLPAVYNDGSERLSSIGGYTLVPMSEAYIGVMNNVSSSKSIDDMLGRLKEMSTNDPKYTKLYNRLTKLKEISKLNNQNDIQLLSAFWRTFKKQSPTVKNVYVLENGDVQVGDSNFTAAARQVEEGFVNNIINAVNNGNKYITYSATSNSYIGNEDSIKDAKLDSLLAQVNFLKEFGIEFDYDRLVKMREKTTFSEAVNGIRTSIAGGKRLITVSGRTLDINKRLYQLSEIKAIMDNPEFSSTFYNVNGELTQTFIGTNAASDLFDVLSQIKNINELQGTQYEYLLTDTFAKNSNMLSRMFDRATGNRIADTEDLMQTAYADGTVDEDSGKQKQSSKLNYKERLLQELNLNLDGYYLNLIPGDATLEWMMNMGNPIAKEDILLNLNRVFDIFKGYFIDEMNLARENRNVAKDRDALDLRFFKSILGEKLHNDIIAEEGEVFTAEEIYDNNKQAIDDAVAKYITLQKDRLSTSLEEYGIMSEVGNGYMVEGLSFAKEDVVPFDEMDRQLKVLSINYMINNIELHKLLYSDPYQYSDELKRIKSFNSPRQAIVGGSDAFNSAANNIWNKGIAEDSIGYTDFNKDFFRSVTLGDVIATSDLPDYGSFEETDGGGMITMKAYRNFLIRAGEWDGNKERQYKYDIAYEKKVKGIKLSSVDRNALKKGNPAIKSAYTPIKPIVSGNKANGRNFNDIVLDKFALFPLSFRVLHEMNPESNAVKLYNKMQDENVDYAVYNSGRKVGAEAVHELYKDGQFNDAPFQTEKQTENKDLKQGVINIPFSIMSIQSEVPSKDDGIVTRGSQMTKLVTLDFMDAGVPIDYNPTGTFTERYMEWFGFSESEKENKSPLYKEIKNNQRILEDMMEVGINSLLKTFGITKVDGGYKIDDFEKVVETLRREFTKREISDNLSAALRGYSNGTVVAEATPAYKQIRNILYSIADREVISPKVNGGMKVQIPSTLLESNRIKAEKGGYTSDVLKFYVDKDGQRVCEIMVGRWFESDLSDEDLLKKLNSTPEGQRILEGVAFRIPTQKQNSIDVFRVAKFLPKEFGDSVVVPSALVKKVGSDFDIDKLSIYLKNVDDSSKGLPRLISVNGKGKSNLENAYIESLERLISHPLNFKNLVKPNSADQLKKLSGEITEKLGFGTFDYKDPGNMLDRRFMSRLRHAFVSGKYAIGIAAVNQTNNSLNQRQPIYIDFAGRKDLLEPGDLKWLGDGKINFPEYNKIEIPGKGVLPTLSLSKNAEGQYISDILGQMIDGYVDISKGPWIMELGATPNVASTWMFLTKVGVPIETVAYFMNQPIIRDYLRTLEKNGQSWLFNDRTNNAIKRKYKNNKLTVKEMPSLDKLKDMVGKKELTQVEKAEQTFILKEFLKYAKMAEQSLNVTQGTNFDTASFNDPFLVFKKLMQLKKARNTIFSSVDDMLDNAFIGKLKDSIIELRDALATILKADQGNVREVIQKVLTPYVGMNDRDFVKTSQRAVATLFDWAVQTQNGLNAQITDILLNKDTNVAKEISEFVKPILDPLNENHPLHNNQVVRILQPLFGKPGEVNNVKIKNKTNKVYDQNQITYAFVELKEYLKGEGKIDLYDRLVTLSILQSGLNESNISFTSQLPYEDIVKQYNEVIADLPANANLDTFADLNVFERTFWNFDDVVPHHKATYRFDFYTQQSYYNEEMKFGSGIYDAMRKGDLPLLLKVKPGSREANYDVVVHTWEKEISSSEKRKMRKDGDYSYKKKGLFKYVGIIPSADGLSETYLYKLINAWGDGTRANEFYTEARKSVIDNKFEQADESIPDDIILQYFGVTKEEMISPLPENIAVSPEIQTSNIVINAVPKENEIIGNIAMQSDNVIRIKAGTKTITNRTENYRDGVYALPDGSRVELTNLGKFQVVGDRVVGDEASYSLDEFAKKEGFQNWPQFKLYNKYSTNFINGKQARFVYAVKPVSSQPTENQQVAEPGEKKATELPSGELVFKDADKRIRIDYPSTIEGMDSKLLQQVARFSSEGEIVSIDDLETEKYGRDVDYYVGETDSDITVEQATFLQNNPIFANEFIEKLLTSEEGDGLTMKEYAQLLLDNNQKLVDTAQTSLFSKEGDVSVELRDGKRYNIIDINGKLLKGMGYSPIEIGKVLKEIC